jgi:hypothetical protein
MAAKRESQNHLVLIPFARWPYSGTRLMVAFLSEEMNPDLRKDLKDFMESIKRPYVKIDNFGLRNGESTLRFSPAEETRLTELLNKREQLAYQKSLEDDIQETFRKRWGEGFKMHTELSRYVKSPRSLLIHS